MRHRAAPGFSRREREIMDIVYAHGRATVNTVLQDMDHPPSYSAVRALMRILEVKGHLRHEKDGSRYVYIPTQQRHEVRRSALQRILATLFGGKVEEAVAALLQASDCTLTEKEYARLSALIRKTRKQGGTHEPSSTR